MYREIKKRDAADGETVGVLADRVLQIAPEYGEGHETYAVLLNALPTLFTFLRIKGMPAHGNATEQEFHNGYAKQRRVRRQIKNQKGALFLGVLVSVVGTCRKRGIPFSVAFLHLLCRRLVEPLRRQATPRGSHHRGHRQQQASEAGALGTHPDKAPARTPARTPAGRGCSGRVIRRLGGGPSSGAPLALEKTGGGGRAAIHLNGRIHCARTRGQKPPFHIGRSSDPPHGGVIRRASRPDPRAGLSRTCARSGRTPRPRTGDWQAACPPGGFRDGISPYRHNPEACSPRASLPGAPRPTAFRHAWRARPAARSGT